MKEVDSYRKWVLGKRLGEGALTEQARAETEMLKVHFERKGRVLMLDSRPL
ncbi:MAG: hypothetical protein JXL20_10300 [Deltaproteobacteria bacterium]|nr:hypothetical protein [Deltaproteobacteria bacterium]